MVRTGLLAHVVIFRTRERTRRWFGAGCREGSRSREPFQSREETKMKRQFILILLCVAVTFPSFASGKTEAAAGEVKAEIVYAYNQEPKSMDPVFTEGYATLVLALFCDPLLKINDKGEYVGVLAESYSVSDDGLSIVLKLRQGIKFHDGTDFDAEAVKWNLDRARTEKKSQYIGDLKSIKEVAVVDKYKVEIRLSAAETTFIDQLVQPIGYMVSPTAAKKLGADFQLTAVGTGPYLFQEWSGGNRVVGIRNKDYWRRDEKGTRLPYSDKVTVRFIVEPSVAMIELQSGNVDVIRSSLIADFKAVDADPKLQKIDPGVGTYQYCAMNNLKPPFDNEKLRQAVNAALDRATIAKVISEAYGQVTTNFISPLSWVYDQKLENPYAYNPQMAKKLLAEAGYPNGFKTTISIVKRDPDVEIGQLMQAQLAKVGIEAVVEITERQAYVEKVVTKREYELATMQVYTSANRGVFLLQNHFGKTDASMNFARFTDANVFDVLAKARTEKKRDTAFKLYAKAQQQVMDHAYWSFLFLRPTYILATKRLVDYKYTSVNGGELSLADTKILAK
jgi:peptide/nickel transport system substrate-binding protein